jgi:hypothetical protein
MLHGVNEFVFAVPNPCNSSESVKQGEPRILGSPCLFTR